MNEEILKILDALFAAQTQKILSDPETSDKMAKAVKIIILARKFMDDIESLVPPPNLDAPAWDHVDETLEYMRLVHSGMQTFIRQTLGGADHE